MIVFKTDTISVNNIANQLRLSKGLVSKYLDILTKRSILKRAKGKFLIDLQNKVIHGDKSEEPMEILRGVYTERSRIFAPPTRAV